MVVRDSEPLLCGTLRGMLEIWGKDTPEAGAMPWVRVLVACVRGTRSIPFWWEELRAGRKSGSR